MYDSAGEWIYKVGMPAKSGVAGGILAVLPGQLGIGAFSPLLDEHGNSVRGIQVCQELCPDVQFAPLQRPGGGEVCHSHRATMRRRSTRGVCVLPRRSRRPAAARGDAYACMSCKATSMFSTVEVVIRDILSARRRRGLCHPRPQAGDQD